MQPVSPSLELFKNIRVLAMDVDGTLTHGHINYSLAGEEFKSFNVQDGLGIVLLLSVGIYVVWLSGRKSKAVEHRAKELNVSYLFQEAKDKGAILEKLRLQIGCEREQIAFVGDDWNDLTAFPVVGLRIAVANAVQEVKEASNFVTERRGGDGAVREVCEVVLRAQGKYETCLLEYLRKLREAEASMK